MALDKQVRAYPRLTTLIVVILVVAAGLGTYFVLYGVLTRPYQSVNKSDGPTFFQARSQAGNSIDGEPGGPWALFSVFGVDAELPFSPNVIGYPLENHTVNVCGTLFDGLTLWNGTVPVFTGTFNSGTAPFWQFAYYSNSTNQVRLATDLLGSVRVYPPVAYPGTCYPWNTEPGPLPWSKALTEVTEDSSSAGASAWNAYSPSLPNQSDPYVQIISLGPNLFDDTGYVTGGYLFTVERCGLSGVAGLQPHAYAAVNWSSGRAVGSGPGGGNCAALSSFQGRPGTDYELLLSPPIYFNATQTSQATMPFQVAFAYASNRTLTGFYDGWGLANWMTGWNVTNSSGARLPLGRSTCDSWVPSISDCKSDSSGWYAVILSQSGEWINSYGLQANGTLGWADPVTALVSHQQLVVVAPSSWNLAGDKLAVSSTVATSTVLGSVTL